VLHHDSTQLLLGLRTPGFTLAIKTSVVSKMLFETGIICYKRPNDHIRGITEKEPRMNLISESIRFLVRNVLEPFFDLVIDHAIVSVIIVVVLIYWAVRGYKML
jgi:hypothetical protein